MFDDEEDMQYEWVDAPDGNVPQVDMILKHRLRRDTSTLAHVRVHLTKTNQDVAKEASEHDKQDFDYFVRPTPLWGSSMSPQD